MRLAINFQNVDPDRGGAETYVVDLCRRLLRAGHSVDLYAERWRDGTLPPELGCVPVPVAGRTKMERIFSFGWNSEELLREADHDCSVGFVNTWHHDVLIPQGGVHGGSLAANAKRYPDGVARGLYLLGKMANPKFWSYRAIERKQYDLERSSRYVAVSRMVMGHLQQYYQVPKSRIHVIPNAIDAGRLEVSQPAAVRCRFRNALGLAPGDLVGLFVGHNYWLKGLKPLLHTLAERKRRRPGARAIKLVVCGGRSVGPFRRMTRSLGLDDSVRLVGFYDDVRDAYHGSDFFVSPTYYDPCSLVVFEALACGLPVITTACNGAGELMTDGREGYVVTAPDALGELTAALEHMADDEARAAMSVHARALGREQSLDRHVERLVKVFETAASARFKSRSRQGPHITRMGSLSRKFIR
jgi:UDP-glucose:(heptosyl)LPS alpha-1,3-glucosyltransferase